MASHSWKENKKKDWAGQQTKWHLMHFHKEKKWGRKNKGKKEEGEGILEREELDRQWQSGKVWRTIVTTEVPDIWEMC